MATAARASARTVAPPEPASPPPVARAKKPESATVARRYRDSALLIRQAADGTRLQILSTLAVGEKNVGELCNALGLTQPAVSHHLCLLKNCNILSYERNGQHIVYSLSERGRVLFDAVRCLIDLGI